jgi:hypothetical protein
MNRLSWEQARKLEAMHLESGMSLELFVYEIGISPKVFAKAKRLETINSANYFKILAKVSI